MWNKTKQNKITTTKKKNENDNSKMKSVCSIVVFESKFNTVFTLATTKH